MEDESDPNFKRILLRRDVLALAVGAMVGFSWVIYASPWTTQGGTIGAVLGFAAVGILCSFIGLAYGELTSVFPRTAGEVLFAYRAFNETVSWFVGWFLLSIYAQVAFFEAVFFPFLLAQIGIPIPQIGALWTIGGQTVYVSWILVSCAGIAIFGGMNYLGIEFSGTAQTIGVFILLFVGALVGVIGIGGGSIQNAQPLITDFKGVSAVIFLAPAFLLGFGTIPQVSEELNIPQETAGKLIPVSIWIAVAFYSLTMLGIGFGAPLDIRSGGFGVADAIANLTGSNLASSLILAGAFAGMLTSWNAFFLSSARVIYGLGRARMLPSWFAKFDEERGVPTNAVHTMVVISVISAFVGYGVMNQLIEIGSFYVIIVWAIVFLAFVKLRKEEPSIDRPFKVPYFTVVSVLGFVAIIFFLINYTPLSPSGGVSMMHWVMIVGYLVLGVILWGGWFKRTDLLSNKERLKRLQGSDESS